MYHSSEKSSSQQHLLGSLINPGSAPGDGDTSPSSNHQGSASHASYDKKSTVRGVKSNYPTPPQSASPSKSAFPRYRDDASAELPSPRQSSEVATSTIMTATASINEENIPRRRGSSLGARFPGDKSHRPLDILRAEQNAARRHQRRTSRVGADSIDQLAQVGIGSMSFHQDGPYEATLLGRNQDSRFSPVAATFRTNTEALRATPREYIRDSVRDHRPLMGVSTVPPGEPDRYGRVLNYKEGTNLNVEMGWKRWQGIDYHPDDIKGKGEPYYTIDRALKDHKKSHRRVVSEGGVELLERPRATSGHLRSASGVDVGELAGVREEPYAEWASAGVQRAHTTGKRSPGMSETLRSRFGSLRRRKPAGEVGAGEDKEQKN